MAVEFEEPDLIILRSRDANPAAADAAMAQIEEWVRDRRYFLMLCDFRDTAPPTADARARIHAWTQRVPIHAVSIVGPPFAVRIVVQMVIRASALFLGREILHHFAADETAARTWLVAQRPVLQRIRDPARSCPSTSRSGRRRSASRLRPCSHSRPVAGRPVPRSSSDPARFQTTTFRPGFR